MGLQLKNAAAAGAKHGKKHQKKKLEITNFDRPRDLELGQ
jgi:hypothetical protein